MGYNQEYYQKNKEKILQKNREYQQENKEKLRKELEKCDILCVRCHREIHYPNKERGILGGHKWH